MVRLKPLFDIGVDTDIDGASTGKPKLRGCQDSECMTHSSERAPLQPDIIAQTFDWAINNIFQPTLPDGGATS